MLMASNVFSDCIVSLEFNWNELWLEWFHAMILMENILKPVQSVSQFVVMSNNYMH